MKRVFVLFSFMAMVVLVKLKGVMIFLSNNLYSSTLVGMGIGQKNYITLPINIFNNFTWDTSTHFQKGDPDTVFIRKENIEIGKKKILSSVYEGNVYKDKEGVLIKNFRFYVTSQHSYQLTEMGIGFGFYFSDKKFSFVHQLYEQNKIPERVFSIEAGDYKNILTIGGVTNDTNRKFKYSSACKVSERYHTWNCGMSRVSYKGKDFIFPKGFTVHFHSLNLHFIYSDIFFNFMENTVLSSKIQGGECKIYRKNNPLSFFICDCKAIENMENLNFLIGNTEISVEMTKLFYVTDIGKCRSDFSSSGDFEGVDSHAVLGLKFFSSFNVVAFDYDKEEVQFFSDNDFMFTRKKISTNVTKQIYVVNFLLLIFQTINLLLLKVKPQAK